jgi:hypothetical protein
MMRVLGVYNVLMALLLVCAGTVLGAKEKKREGYGVKERHHVPRRWKRIGEAPGGHLIQLQIGLKQEGFEELERHLFEGTLEGEFAAEGRLRIWPCHVTSWSRHVKCPAREERLKQIESQREIEEFGRLWLTNE